VTDDSRLTTDDTRAVFLDRDGTLIEEINYLGHIDDVRFYPWSAEAVRALNRAGLRVIVVTNQSGVARGFFDETVVHNVHRFIGSVLNDGGARIDAFYYCPHHPDGKVPGYARACDCRKPGPGMIDRAAREMGIDPKRSFVVGDNWLDVRLARTVGARGILVRTGIGRRNEAHPPAGVTADAVVDNLVEAVGWILTHL
jgi:D-glycero-D-manno-heptose 1,7-bisphosphate phosphatase